MNYNKIEEVRKAKGLSKNYFLSQLEMSRQGFDTALKNKTLKVRDLEKIADILDVSITDFFDSSRSQSQLINFNAQNGNGNINSSGGSTVKSVIGRSGDDAQLVKEKAKSQMLNQENHHLKEQLRLKDEIIELLKK